MRASTGLLGFRYFKWQRVLALALIITAASLLFSLTALSLLGFYRGLNAYLGEGEDIIAIYNPKTRTPYTSVVPAYLADRLAAVNGVLASSPEVTAPCLVNGQAVFLRGTLLENFVKLSPLRIVKGTFLNPSDTDSAIVGKNVAERLGLDLNDRVLFLGVFADTYAELQVKGIFASNSIMDDEVLAPLHVGQWLRGIDYNHVTLIRLKIDRNAVTSHEIFEVVADESSQPSQPSPSQPQPTPQEPLIPWTITLFSIEDVGVEEAVKFMKSYMDRYGVTRESLLVLSAAVFLFSSSTTILASRTIITQHKGEINVLRSLGASKKLLKLDMIIKLLPWIIVASIIGIIVASAILTIVQGYGYLQVLSHTVSFQLDLLVIALNIILTFALVSVSIWKGNIE